MLFIYCIWLRIGLDHNEQINGKPKQKHPPGPQRWPWRWPAHPPTWPPRFRRPSPKGVAHKWRLKNDWFLLWIPTFFVFGMVQTGMLKSPSCFFFSGAAWNKVLWSKSHVCSFQNDRRVRSLTRGMILDVPGPAFALRLPGRRLLFRMHSDGPLDEKTGGSKS